MDRPLADKEILLGVTGGIAAYKSCELVRLLREAGASVTVVMTASGARFVTPLSFRALTGRPVLTCLFDETGPAISHIEATRKADVFIVAPATANVIGKMASGIADDLLTTMLMAAGCPVLLAPAMNCRMFENPVTKRNIETLKGFGVQFVGPEKGKMACDEQGWGRMSEPGDILDAATGLVARAGALSGRKALVTAGPTIEDIDPVRFIGNRSTGKMGYAVARAARARGAEVTLVTGPTSIEPPAGVSVVKVRSASEMEGVVRRLYKDADIVVMAAAVADYAPEKVAAQKLKKGPEDMTLRLIKTPDIIAGLVKKKRKGQFIVGFAAETETLDKNAVKKLKEKGLDMIAANPIGGGEGFGGDHNALKIFDKKGLVADTGRVTKQSAAEVLVDCICKAARF